MLSTLELSSGESLKLLQFLGISLCKTNGMRCLMPLPFNLGTMHINGIAKLLRVECLYPAVFTSDIVSARLLLSVGSQ